MNVRRWLLSSLPLLAMAIGIVMIRHANALTTGILVMLGFGVGALVSCLDAMTRANSAPSSDDDARLGEASTKPQTRS